MTEYVEMVSLKLLIYNSDMICNRHVENDPRLLIFNSALLNYKTHEMTTLHSTDWFINIISGQY